MDNTFLTLLLNPKAAPRPNPATGEPVPYCRERIESLIDEISARSGTLIVPAPSLAKCLCGTDSPAAYIEALAVYDNIEIAPFDQRAAYELSQAMRKADTGGDKRSGQTGNWQHVKMDRAIVAIALVYGASTLYSDDDRQCNFARMSGLNAVHTWDLDLSSKWSQAHLQDGSGRAWPEQKVPPKPTLEHPRTEGRPEDA